jgi:hypothetical protein
MDKAHYLTQIDQLLERKYPVRGRRSFWLALLRRIRPAGINPRPVTP